MCWCSLLVDFAFCWQHCQLVVAFGISVSFVAAVWVCFDDLRLVWFGFRVCVFACVSWGCCAPFMWVLIGFGDFG